MIGPGLDLRGAGALTSAALLLLALAFAPVFFGAVLPWTWVALLVTLLLAAALLVAADWRDRAVLVPCPPLVACAAATLLVIVVQLLPLPSAVVGVVSPAAAEIHASLAAGGWQALSLDRSGSLDALFKGLLYLAAGLVAARSASDPRRARALLLVLLGVCAFESFYGLVEQFAGEGRILGWAKPAGVVAGRASGTYVNPNHLAGLLAMGIPVALATAAISPGTSGVLPRERGGALVAILTHPDLPKRVLLAFAGVITAAGLAGSFSKGGLLAAAAGCVGVALLVARTRPAGRAWAFTAVALTVVGLVVVELGLERFVERFRDLGASTGPGVSGRLQFNIDTLRMVADYPALGVGAGAFEATFPRYHVNTSGAYVDHAHADYVQLLAELGLVPALVLLAGIASAVRATWRSARALGGEREAIALTALVGLVPIAVHSLLDFNLRIPANALWASVLLGTAWGVAHPEGGRSLRLPTRAWARLLLALALVAAAAVIASAAFLLARADWEARPQIERAGPDERPPLVRVEALARAVTIWPFEARLWGKLAAARWEAARATESEAAQEAARAILPEGTDEVVAELAARILTARLETSADLSETADQAEAEATRALALAPADPRWAAILAMVRGERP